MAAQLRLAALGVENDAAVRRARCEHRAIGTDLDREWLNEAVSSATAVHPQPARHRPDSALARDICDATRDGAVRCGVPSQIGRAAGLSFRALLKGMMALRRVQPRLSLHWTIHRPSICTAGKPCAYDGRCCRSHEQRRTLSAVLTLSQPNSHLTSLFPTSLQQGGLGQHSFQGYSSGTLAVSAQPGRPDLLGQHSSARFDCAAILDALYRQREKVLAVGAEAARPKP